MNIFNSLGSNYNFSFVLSCLNSKNTEKNPAILSGFLKSKYKGEVKLFYKGREALEAGLKSLNLPSQSFVAVCGFTCFAVYESIKNSNLNTEYLDIELGELNFSKEILESAFKKNPKIKVVIIQNTLGYPCDIKNISKFCKENKLILIEDLAHSVGTKYSDGSEAGTIGDLTALSFSQDKIVDGVSGGALINKTGNNDSIINTVKLSSKTQAKDRVYPLLTYLIRKTYPIVLGKILHKILKNFKLLSGPMDKKGTVINSLPNWYCDLINNSLSKLDQNLMHRKKIATIYAESINSKVVSSKIISSVNLSTNLRFPIFVNNREGLIKYLKNFGVFVSDIWYDAPIAPKKYLSQTDYKNQCPNSQLASNSILNLPTHINISEIEAKSISNLINKWITLQ
jgi:perosamine synthetase